MIIQVFSAFWAVAMFSILTETPKKFLPYAAFSGGFAWWAYLVINNLTHSTLQAAFFSILAVAFLSHILARIMKAPVTYSSSQESFRLCLEQESTVQYIT